MSRRPKMHASPFSTVAATRMLLVAASLAVFLVPAVTRAQAFGQWWWAGSAGFVQSSRQNERAGVEIDRYDTSTLRLQAALNGFVLHPAIGEFRLDAEALLSDFSGSRLDGSDRLGGGLDVTLLPRSRNPLRVYWQHRAFDYTLPQGRDPATLDDDPSSSTEWGASWNAGSGRWLKGLGVGLRRASFDYLGPDTREGVDADGHISWNRSFGRVRHRFTVRRNRRLFGTRDYDLETVSAQINESGSLERGGFWSVNGSAYERETRFRDDTSDGTSYQLAAQLTQVTRRQDRIETTLNLDAFRLGFGDEPEEVQRDEGLGVRGAYRWRLGPGLELSPFIQYSQQDSRRFSDSGAGLGLGIRWVETGRAWHSALSASLQSGQREIESAGERDETGFESININHTLVHGEASTLKKELEINFARGAFVRDSRPGSTLVELGLAATPGDTTQSRVRAALKRRSSHLRLDWTTRQQDATPQSPRLESETLSVTVQYTRGPLDVSGQLGETLATRDPLPEQTIRFANAGVVWRPIRPLELILHYRQDERDTELTPRLGGETYEARGSFRVGQLSIEGRFFDTKREFAEQAEQRNRGFEWSIRRHFAGLLPVVSAPKRRGTIR